MQTSISSNIDIKENSLLKIDKELLEILLKDKSTKKNIIWATDNYKKYGEKYFFDKQIFTELITSFHGNIIKPRTEKSKAEQQQRVRQKAEVFTPSWVCNKQNNLLDNAWFGRENVFNVETNDGWQTNFEKITFESGGLGVQNGNGEAKSKTWKDYVELNRMEISCGEAPYITSRYDATTGDYIDVKNRIGLLDRKLRVVSENTEAIDEWLKWAFTAVKSVYGFDWQGDNVLIARENVLFTVIEFYKEKFSCEIETSQLLEFAKIICWNIWQMDGLKFVVPESCTKQKKQADTSFLFEEMFEKEEFTKCEGCKKGDNTKHTGIYCKIMDWKTGKTVRYVDLVTKGE